MATTYPRIRPRGGTGRHGGRPRDGSDGWLRGPLWLQAAAVFLVLRLVSWALLHQAAKDQPWFAGITGSSPRHIDLALSWDAQWYHQIAQFGYPDHLPLGPDGTVQQNPWAFYPAFPYTVRWVTDLTGVGFALAAPLLALLAGLGAAIVMAHLFRATLPSRATGAALGAVAIWAAFPSSPVLQMAYTESFAMLLLVGCLLLVVRRQWWLVGGCALLLGLTRPIALPLVIVVLVAAGLRWREVGPRLLRSSEATAIGFAVVATGLSGLLWPAIAWAGTGRRDAYTATMSSWRGGQTVHPAVWKDTIDYAWTYHTKIFVVPALSLVIPLALALVILIPRVAPGIDIRLRVWTAAYALYLLVVVDAGTSIVRYLVPLFPLALVLVGAHRERAGAWVSAHWRWRTAFWVAAGIVGQVGWIWWLVLFTPPSDFPP